LNSDSNRHGFGRLLWEGQPQGTQAAPPLLLLDLLVAPPLPLTPLPLKGRRGVKSR
jgi:hypothetical protein